MLSHNMMVKKMPSYFFYKKIEAYKNHYMMWDWLVQNPGEGKKDYFIQNEIAAPDSTFCYLCEVHKRDCYRAWRCKKCPLYKLKLKECGSLGSIYRSWVYFDVYFNEEQRQYYALLIRNCVIPFIPPVYPIKWFKKPVTEDWLDKMLYNTYNK